MSRRRLGGRGRIVLGAVALLAIVLLWFLWSLFQPLHGGGSGRVTVVIPRGSGIGDIGDILDKRGVVSSSFFFQARATIEGKRGDLKPGNYVLRHDMSYAAALKVLSAGPPRNIVTVLLPEGLSRAQIATSVRRDGLTGNYLAATKRSPLLDPGRYGGRHAASLEGFLFPATYQLKRGSSVRALVAKQLADFKREFATVDLKAARHVNLTAYDVLTIASLVEREAEAPSERPLVASVIYNRLRAHIPLGIDATTRFQFNDWTRALTGSQLRSPSPYNTRIHQGLPPGPIGNPGLASIHAAAHPAKTKFLYYVADCNHPGRHVFTRTLAAFNAAAARYQAARAKAGGRAPTHC